MKKKIQKISKYTLIVGFFLVFFAPLVSYADTIIKTEDHNYCDDYIIVYADKISAVANGTDSIKITPKLRVEPPAAQGNSCSNYDDPIDEPSYITISVSGTGNTITKTTLNPTSTTYGSIHYLEDLSVDFEPTYIKSTTAETKSLAFTVYWNGSVPDAQPRSGGTVTFTAEPSAKSTSSSGGTTPTKNQAKEQQEEKPDAPLLTKIRVGENELTGEKIREENRFRRGEAIIFAGTSIPNAKVYLYFHSETFEDSTMSDDNGNWEYTLTKNLGAGTHSLEIAVQDPETGEISETSEPISFVIEEGILAENEKPTLFWALIILASVAVIGGGIGSWIYYKKRSKNKKDNQTKKPEKNI